MIMQKSLEKYLAIVIFLVLGLSNALLFTNEISYSLHDCNGIPLDQKLVEILDYSNGIFIEAGAHDGITQSNTKLLEEVYGWSGILIEPSEIVFSSLYANRPHSKCFHCALGSFEQNNTLVEGDFDGGLMSSVNAIRTHRNTKQTVLMRSLQSILDETNIQHINFFSLDTEGYELNILLGIDFSKTKFDYILVEIYAHQYDEIKTFLAENGYDLIENFTNYNQLDNPIWDGTHNDYLFKRNTLRD